jgi:hypothetical protein
VSRAVASSNELKASLRIVILLGPSTWGQLLKFPSGARRIPACRREAYHRQIANGAARDKDRGPRGGRAPPGAGLSPMTQFASGFFGDGANLLFRHGRNTPCRAVGEMSESR